MSTNRHAPTLLVLAALGLAACSTDDGRTMKSPTDPLPATTTASTEPTESSTPQPLNLVAPWQDGAEIPVRHTCDDADLSPALTWINVPVESVELAITVTDLDAGGFAHWIVYGISPNLDGVAEDGLPEGSFEWENTFGVDRYSGPCPPAGESHRYNFTIHALNQQLEVADDASATEVISMLNLVAIAQGSLTGTYIRSGE